MLLIAIIYKKAPRVGQESLKFRTNGWSTKTSNAYNEENTESTCIQLMNYNNVETCM